MAKILNTRIRLKYDTFKNWTTNDPILLMGEVGITILPVSSEETIEQTTKPALLLKVGDGVSTYNKLPWVSGLAADVYGWAKEATKPSYNANEIKNLKEFVENISDIDTNTKYQIIAGSKTGLFKLQAQEKGSSSWTNVGNEFGIDKGSLDSAIQAAQNKADSAYNLANSKQSPATTLAGYGINDAKIANGVITLGANTITPLVKHQDISGKADKTDVIGSVTGSNDTITVTTLSGAAKNKTITINNVSHAGTATKATQDANGNVITSTYATKTELKNQVAASVQYLGVVKTLSGLSTTAGKGDFYRAGASFNGADAGDLLIAEIDNPKQVIGDTGYNIVKSTDDYKGTVTNVTVSAGSGLSGGGSISTSGTITLNHADTSSQGSVNNSGRTVIQDITLDEYGHITGIGSATLGDADTKNTTGAADTTGKIFIVGSKEQTTNPVTYTEANAYIQDGAVYSEGKKVLTDHQSHQSIKSINTNNTSAQTVGSENVAGSGVIQLHKISKTGSYNDLNNKPTIPAAANNGTFTVTGGNGLTGSGSGSANQSGSTSATLAVGQGTGITVSADSVSVTDYGNIITSKGNICQDENGNKIIFDCGTSSL